MSDESFDAAGMDEWLENYFLDPLTSYLDHTQFRIDLYETEKEWIVEAYLKPYDSSEIKVYMEEQELVITAMKSSPVPEGKKFVRKRTVSFPFQITQKNVIAKFNQGTLEIYISKIDGGPGKNRFVTLP